MAALIWRKPSANALKNRYLQAFFTAGRAATLTPTKTQCCHMEANGGGRPPTSRIACPTIDAVIEEANETAARR
jgi:hypothetical protein